MSTDSRAQVVIDGDHRPLRQALREATADMKNFGEKGGNALTGIHQTGMSLKATLTGLAASLMSATWVTTFLHVQKLKDELGKAAQKAGVTTEQFSAMAYAAKLADVDTEQLGKAYAKLGVLLTDAQQGQKEAVETFRRLKLDPKNIKDADVLLMELADRFSNMEDGAKKVALSVDIFGKKIGPGLIPFLNAGRNGLVELREEAAKLGIVVSTEAGREAEKFNDSLTTMGTAVRGASMQIGNVLIPKLTEAAEFFTKVAKESGVWEATLVSIGRIMAKGLGIDDVGKAETNYKNLKTLSAEAHKNLADMYKEAARNPNATTAQGVIEKLTAKIKLLDDAVLKAGAAIGQVDGKNAGGGRGFVNPDRVRVAPWDPEAKVPTAAAAAPKAPIAAPTSYMPYYELYLAEDKQAAAILEAGREYSKERELAYWREILANLQVTQADRVAILRKAAGLEVEIARKANAERKEIDAELASQAEAMALGKLDAERATNRVALDLGALTNAQLLQLEANLEQQRYEIQRAALQARLALLADDPASSPVERERINGRLLELDRQYQVKRIEIMGGIAKEGAGGDFWSSMTGGFGNALNGLISRTQTWAQAIGNVFSGVRDTFIRVMVTEPFGKWVAGQAAMLAAKFGFITTEKAAMIAGSAATVGIKAAETTAVSGGNAVQAGTGAAAAMASIPFIGPLLAIAAMATVFAAVSGLGKGKSAAGGYDIPSGINPLVQTHAEEMILPAQISNSLRGMIAEGSSGGGGRGDTFNMSVQAMDARSFKAFALDNSDAFASAMRRARRDNS